MSASLTSIQGSKHCPSGLDHGDGHQRVFALVVEERVVQLSGERSEVAQRTKVTGGDWETETGGVAEKPLMRLASSVSALSLLSGVKTMVQSVLNLQ